MSKIYVAGSLRNPVVLETACKIKEAGHEVFVDWFGGGPGADDAWRDAEKALGFNLKQALRRPMAQNIIQFDTRWLDWSDIILVVKPGTSSSMELARQLFHSKKPGYALFPDGDPERWDVMLAWATDIFYSVDEFLEEISQVKLGPEYPWKPLTTDPRRYR